MATELAQISSVKLATEFHKWISKEFTKVTTTSAGGSVCITVRDTPVIRMLWEHGVQTLQVAPRLFEVWAKTRDGNYSVRRKHSDYLNQLYHGT